MFCNALTSNHAQLLSHCNLQSRRSTNWRCSRALSTTDLSSPSKGYVSTAATILNQPV